jgi:hypothetical protein
LAGTLALTVEEWEILRRSLHCPQCANTGVLERLATPDEVDDGRELGIAYDPCPNAWHWRPNT